MQKQTREAHIQIPCTIKGLFKKRDEPVPLKHKLGLLSWDQYEILVSQIYELVKKKFPKKLEHCQHDGFRSEHSMMMCYIYSIYNRTGIYIYIIAQVRYMGWRYLQMLLLFGQQLEDGSSDIQRIIEQGEFYRIPYRAEQNLWRAIYYS